MSNIRNSGQWSLVSGQGSTASYRRVLVCLLVTVCCSLLLGCRRDMQDQPRYEAYESSTFFKDGQASRPLVEGTVPRGDQFLREDDYYWTGKNGGDAARVPASGGATGGIPTSTGNTQSSSNAGGQLTGDVNVRGNTAGGIPAGSGAGNTARPAGMTGGNFTGSGAGATAGSQGGDGSNRADIPSGADVFPFPITEEVLNRGQERFNAYCAMCHGMTGAGDGMIVRRGFRKPPSLHEDRLQAGAAAAPHYFDVITNGWGAMPAYADLVPVEDRWKIIAYIRALQLSQRATVDDVPVEKRGQLGGAAPGAPAAGQQGGGYGEGGPHR